MEEEESDPKRVFKSSCEVCHRRFVTARVPNLHVQMHSGERPFECPVCGQRFMNPGHLRQHRAVHDLVCEGCGDAFSERKALRVHLRAVHGGLPCQCQDCGQRFPSAARLRNHARVHADQSPSPHECDVCYRRCKDGGGLKRHLASHKQFECSICRRSFADAHALRGHVWDQHIEASQRQPGERTKRKKRAVSKRKKKKKAVVVKSAEEYSDGVVEEPAEFQCAVCQETLLDTAALREHVWRTHVADGDQDCPDEVESVWEKDPAGELCSSGKAEVTEDGDGEGGAPEREEVTPVTPYLMEIKVEPPWLSFELEEEKVEPSTPSTSCTSWGRLEPEENPYGLVKGGYMNALAVVESFLKQETQETAFALPEDPEGGDYFVKQNAEETLFESGNQLDKFLKPDSLSLAVIDSYLKQ